MGNKRILVTGGAGFIGSHLCRELLKGKNEVICLDNLFTGNKRNIEDLLRNSNFDFICQDITLPFSFKVDEIYNLACPASPIHYQFDPIHTMKTNILGAIHVLELANKYNAKVLQASTSEVYGDPLIHPQPESYWGNVNPIGIRSCYDEGKRSAETLFFDYNRQRHTKIKVVRIFNTYGSYMHPQDGRVVSNFIIQALKDESITIYGNGMQTRSFCYVSDLVQGMIKMMQTADEFNGPINLGNPTEFTMLDLAKKVLLLTKSNSNLIFKDLPQDDPKKRRPDIALAKKVLNWSPQISLDEGLEFTIDYFKGLIGCK